MYLYDPKYPKVYLDRDSYWGYRYRNINLIVKLYLKDQLKKLCNKVLNSQRVRLRDVGQSLENRGEVTGSRQFTGNRGH